MNPRDTLQELVRPGTGRDGLSIALLAPSRDPFTYDALLQQTAAIIAALRRADVSRRDRVAVVLPNGPEMAAVTIALASGAVCAPLNPGCGEDEIRFYLTDLQPAALVLAADDHGAARVVATELGVRCLEARWSGDWRPGVWRSTVAMHRRVPTTIHRIRTTSRSCCIRREPPVVPSSSR